MSTPSLAHRGTGVEVGKGSPSLLRAYWGYSTVCISLLTTFQVLYAVSSFSERSWDIINEGVRCFRDRITGVDDSPWVDVVQKNKYILTGSFLVVLCYCFCAKKQWFLGAAGLGVVTGLMAKYLLGMGTGLKDDNGWTDVKATFTANQQIVGTVVISLVGPLVYLAIEPLYTLSKEHPRRVLTAISGMGALVSFLMRMC